MGAFILRASQRALESLEEIYSGPHVTENILQDSWWEQKSLLLCTLRARGYGICTLRARGYERGPWWCPRIHSTHTRQDMGVMTTGPSVGLKGILQSISLEQTRKLETPLFTEYLITVIY